MLKTSKKRLFLRKNLEVFFMIENFKKGVGILLIMLCFAVIFLSCSGKKAQDQEVEIETETAVEYPISIIPTRLETNLTDNNKLYPVTQTFLQEFLEIANRFQGQSLTIKAEIPQEWGVVCVEGMADGRELYLLQSENREWMYLVITAGYGSERVIDALPISVNFAVQEGEVLETEKWICKRTEEGLFQVEKNYEWVRSVNTDTISATELTDYNKTSFLIDSYKINEMSRFEFVQTETEPDYQAVVFYYKQDSKPEEWDEYIPIVQSYCEENQIPFVEVSQNFEQVVIRDYELNEITTVDITPYISSTESGMVMMKKGKEPKCEIFGNFNRMRVEVKRYFKIIIP